MYFRNAFDSKKLKLFLLVSGLRILFYAIVLTWFLVLNARYRFRSQYRNPCKVQSKMTDLNTSRSDK